MDSQTGLVKVYTDTRAYVFHVPHIRRDRMRIPAAIRKPLSECALGESPWPVFIYGPPGTGKTCAGLAFLDHTKIPNFYYTVTDWTDRYAMAKTGRLMSESFHPVTLSVNDIRGDIGKATVGVLDELGSRENVSDSQYEAIKLILDVRQDRPLVLISNLNLDELSRVYDDRIASRCAAGTVVDTSDLPDFRIERQPSEAPA